MCLVSALTIEFDPVSAYRLGRLQLAVESTHYGGFQPPPPPAPAPQAIFLLALVLRRRRFFSVLLLLLAAGRWLLAAASASAFGLRVGAPIAPPFAGRRESKQATR
jgi:hypothetical protein